MLYLKASEYGIRDLYFQAQHGITVLGRQFVIDEWLPNKNTELAKRKCRQYLESNIVCVLVEFSDRFGIYLDLDKNMDILVSYEQVNFNFNKENDRPNGANFAPPRRSQPNNRNARSTVSQNQPRRQTATQASRPKLENTYYRSPAQTRIETPRQTAPKRVEKKQSFEISTFDRLSDLIEKISANLDHQSEKQFRTLLSERLIFDSKVISKILKQSFLEYVGPIADLIYQDVVHDLGKVETFEEFKQLFELLAREIDEPSYQEQFRDLVSESLIFEREIALRIVREALKQSVGPIADTIYQEVLDT
ncbi:MAG: hypothetical protein QNJ38_20370 [Prochloraceae cyanobacterium]|nr:hypothetical protein [Prochloraceae cyanobacterium]